MGLLASAFFKDPQVDKESDEEKNKRLKNERVVKLLLYGPGEVGKTTILRKMMIEHGNNLETDRERYRPNLCYNVVEGAYLVIRHSSNLFNFNFEDVGFKTSWKGVDYEVTEADARHARRITQAMIYFQSHSQTCTLNPSAAGKAIPGPNEAPDGPSVVESVLHFYDNNAWFKKVLGFRNRFSLYENWNYFAEQLRNYPEWGGQKWIPTDQDLLMSRMRTTGMNKFVFSHENTKYQLIDVGGQRQERTKFTVLLSTVDAVLFVCSLADYDEKCFEDLNFSRLTEAINTWKTVINSDAVKDKWVILLFNKLDLFKVKYYDKGIKIKVGFKYDTKPPKKSDELGRDCEKALQWFEDLYMSVVPENKKSQVRTYQTTTLGDDPDHSIQAIMPYCVEFLVNKLIEGGI